MYDRHVFYSFLVHVQFIFTTKPFAVLSSFCYSQFFSCPHTFSYFPVDCFRFFSFSFCIRQLHRFFWAMAPEAELLSPSLRKRPGVV